MPPGRTRVATRLFSESRRAEVIRGVRDAADLHALGLVLYELSCGTNPNSADDLPQALNRILRELGEV